MNWLFSLKRDKPKADHEQKTDDTVELLGEIEKAKQQWIHTQLFLDWADDSESIDYAIYSIEAAERRYMYLLNKAKKMGVVAKPTF
jgi:hypothetical protein